MANTLTIAQLEQARTLINQGNLSGFYSYMAGQGYKYASLAQQFVDETGSGAVAIGFMKRSAAASGINLTNAQVDQIKTKMANGWVGALEDYAQQNGGVVDVDLRYRETRDFHSDVFRSVGLSPESWTLYQPGQVFGPANSEAMWQDVLNNPGGVLGDLDLYKNVLGSMSFCASACTDPATKAKASDWLHTMLDGNPGYEELFDAAAIINSFGGTFKYLNGVRLGSLESNVIQFASGFDIDGFASKLTEAETGVTSGEVFTAEKQRLVSYSRRNEGLAYFRPRMSSFWSRAAIEPSFGRRSVRAETSSTNRRRQRGRTAA